MLHFYFSCFTGRIWRGAFVLAFFIPNIAVGGVGEWIVACYRQLFICRVFNNVVSYDWETLSYKEDHKLQPFYTNQEKNVNYTTRSVAIYAP